MPEDQRRGLFAPAAAAALVFAIAAASASAASTHVGFAWAENDYLDHIDQIDVWAQQAWAMAPGGLRTDLTHRAWDLNRPLNPHPPLYKYLGLLGKRLAPSLGFPRAERLPSALLYGASCALIFFVLARRRGWLAALTGAAAVGAMPRFFGYAMFCTPDLPLSAAWLAAALLHERFEVTRGKRWLAALCLAFAFGLGTKISALPMLAPLGALTVLWRFRQGFWPLVRGASALALVLAVGLIALVALYPFLWPAPLERLLLLFHEARSWGSLHPFHGLFFGRSVRFTELPWYFAEVILFLVTPPLTLALALWGAAGARRRDTLWQVAVAQLGFWLLLMAVPATPKYDNERQLLPMLPFVGLLAGLGAADLLERLGRALRTRYSRAILVLASAGAAAALVSELAFALPFPLSYFSPAIGGLRGGVELGFEPTNQMEVLSADVLAAMFNQMPPNAQLTVLPAEDIGLFLDRRHLLPAGFKARYERGPWYILVRRHVVMHGVGADVTRDGRFIDCYLQDGICLAELWYRPWPEAPAKTPP